MANPLRSLRRRIERLEKQGFILPSYLHNISRPETAKKWTRENIIAVSKFREIYKGKERIVTGERGKQLLHALSAEKARQTRERKKREGIDTILTFERQFQILDRVIRNYFDRIPSDGLSKYCLQIYESQLQSKGNSFIKYLLQIESKIIRELQEFMQVNPSDDSSVERSMRNWLDIMMEGHPTEEQITNLGVIEDENSQEQVI